MFFRLTALSMVALLSARGLTLPAPPTDQGMISKASTSGQAGTFHLTNLHANKTSDQFGAITYGISFTTTDASNASLTAACAYSWPSNGSYYQPYYTQCSANAYQFLIMDGTFANVTTFDLEITRSNPPIVESNGQEFEGITYFSQANVTEHQLGCIGLGQAPDYDSTFDCGQLHGRQGKITAQLIALDGG